MNNKIKLLEKKLENCTFDDLWILKGIIECTLRDVYSIKTNNFTGERAEDLAIDFYSNNTELPTLTKTLPDCRDFDAYSKTNGKRYSIKGFKGKNTTSSSICAFNNEDEDYNFEYMILVKIDNFYQLLEILELPIDVVIKYKNLNNRDKNFKISYTQKLKNDLDTRIIYSSKKNV